MTFLSDVPIVILSLNNWSLVINSLNRLAILTCFVSNFDNEKYLNETINTSMIERFKVVS